MTKYAHEAGGVRRFVPASLENLPSPPVFLLKEATRRERTRHSRMLIEEGLRLHSKEAIRDETLRALAALWSPEAFAEHEPRLLSYWDATDQYAKEAATNPEIPAFEHPDMDSVQELVNRLHNAWPPLRKMSADIIQYEDESPRIMVCVLCSGWEGLPVPVRKEDGILPLQLVDDLSDALGNLERAHEGKIDGVSPGLAFAQLSLECMRTLYVTKAEEKNSASPSLSTATPISSKTDGKEAESGLSAATLTEPTPAT